MITRRASWPRGILWVTIALTAIAVMLIVGWVFFVPTADWLASHDVGKVTRSLQISPLQVARDAARGRLLTLVAGLFAAGALIFTAGNFVLSRRAFQLTEQGQVTERYTKAIEQLGSEKLNVCIGGIYALERIARDSARDHPTVMEVLATFVCEYSLEEWPPSSRRKVGLLQGPRPDVQAALTVIGRRNASYDRQPINLIGANLANAELAEADLTNVNLSEVNFDRAWLTGAKLTGANFYNASLVYANLKEVNLDGTNIKDADLNNAQLSDDATVPKGWRRGCGGFLGNDRFRSRGDGKGS